MKHFFIMNPAAGKGTKFHNLIDEIHKVCDRRKVSYEIHITEKIGEATEYVKEICQSSEEQVRFYACGGDGTIKEVANGIFGFENAELGIIPMGTGNDFVKNFEHIEMFFDIDAQLDGETRKIDLMKYNNKYAVNLINIGFDCEIAKQAALNRRNIFIPSKVAYTTGIVQKITQLGTAVVKGKLFIDGVQHKWSQSKGYTIPWGCLVPLGVEGLLLSGRNISGTHMAHSNYRVMPICVGIGEAGGVAAAIAAKENVRLRDIPAEKIQQYLL